VVIPALDEQDSIALVISEVPLPARQIIVVDNGSGDSTALRAQAAGARVVWEPRRGYGQACLTGIAAADDARIIAFVDADYSDYPSQLTELLAPLLSGAADLVIGSRQLGTRARGAHPWHAVLGTRLSVALMNKLIGTHATDLGPFRAIRADALRSLGMNDRNFGWTVEMQVKAARQGLRVLEQPVDYRPRIGRSKVSGTLSGSVLAGVKIVGMILRHARSTPS
jgi:glycosyltransferase involved in cell wall biosynthesis